MKRFAFVLMLSASLFSQADAQDLAKEVTAKFENWQKNSPQVKAFAFFNQQKYAPGDTAFFKAYFLSEQLKRVGGRQILTLSLVNSAGEVTGTETFGIRDGVGFNQFVIPDTLSAGYYRFTFFCDWMKNFDPAFFFQQEVEVVRQNKIARRKVDLVPSMRFFPEGGTLVAGISNKVILVGAGLSAAAGELRDEDNNLITSFRLEDGMGMVIFTPQLGRKYFAQLDGQRFELPESKADGLALLVTPGANDRPTKVLLSAPEKSTHRNGDFMMVITLRGEIYFSAIVRLGDKDFAQVMIPQQDFPAGVAQLSVIGQDRHLVASRLFLVEESRQAKVTLHPTAGEVQARQKIEVEVSLADESGNPLAGEFAISAVQEKYFDRDSLRDFGKYLSINSDLPEGDLLTQKGLPQFDLWLITQKWSRFDWSRILGEKRMEPAFRMNTMLSMKGRAFYGSNGEPMPDSTLVMVYLQKHMMGYESYTFNSGVFELPFLFDFWGSDEIFYLAESKRRDVRDIRIQWISDHVAMVPSGKSMVSEESDTYGSLSTKRKLINQSYAFFSRKAKQQEAPADPNAEFEDEVTGADVSVNVQDYIIFPNMIELIREIIPSLQHRKLGGKTTVRVLVSDLTMLPTGDPLYVIDGVMTKNTEFFLGLNPADLLTIKVVKDANKLRRFGPMGKNGMVLVQTKKLDLQKLRDGSTTISVAGLSKPVVPATIQHGQDKNLRVPDFRSTLAWSPSEKIDANGSAKLSWYASDDTGWVIISVQGMTTDGRPFQGTTRVHVSFAGVVSQK